MLTRTVPALLAIIPISMLFGVLSAKADWSILEVFLISFLGFTGSGQFAVLPLAESGLGIMSLFIITASINSRYFPMAILSANRLHKNFFIRLISSHTLGDEAFVIENKRDSSADILIIRLIIFITWVLSSIAGALLVDHVPAHWISSNLNLGFPASIILLYLSFMQLSQVSKHFYLLELSVIIISVGISVVSIITFGVIYFWIPSVIFTSFFIYYWKKI